MYSDPSKTLQATLENYYVQLNSACVRGFLDLFVDSLWGTSYVFIIAVYITDFLHYFLWIHKR